MINKKVYYLLLLLLPLLVQMRCVDQSPNTALLTDAQRDSVTRRFIRDSIAQHADTSQAARLASAMNAAPDSSNRAYSRDTTNQHIGPPEIHYHTILLTKHRRDSLLATDTNHLALVLALNRVDENHLAKLKTIIVPDTFIDLKFYAPFPDSVAELRSYPKLILFSYPAEAFAAYENGVLTRWGAISLGKKTTPTPVGLYHTNWRSPEKRSTDNDEWIMKWYFNLDDKTGVSMHQYDLPGFPASHACVRLSEQDAIWFYDWAEANKTNHKKLVSKGTPVIIYGTYAYGQRKPWLALTKNNKALYISEEDLVKEIEEYLPQNKGKHKIS